MTSRKIRLYVPWVAIGTTMVCNVLSLLLHATISVYGLLNLTNRDLLPVSIDLFHVLQFERSDCAIFSKSYLTCQLFIIYTVF